MECLGITLWLLLDTKTGLFYSPGENSQLNKSRKRKRGEKNKTKQQNQFLSSFEPSCHCFPRWLWHKRGVGVSPYKLALCTQCRLNRASPKPTSKSWQLDGLHHVRTNIEQKYRRRLIICHGNKGTLLTST